MKEICPFCYCYFRFEFNLWINGIETMASATDTRNEKIPLNRKRETHTHEKRNCLQEDSKMCRHNKYQKRNFVFVPSIFFPIEKKIKYKNIRTLILNWEDVLPRLYYKHFGWTTGEETKPIEKRIRIVLKFVSNERIDSTHI